MRLAAAPVAARASAARCSSATPAPRPTRRRSSSPARRAPAATIVVAARRLPRAHLRRAVGDAAGVQAGAVRAARARLPRGRADARGARGGGRRAHRGGAARADPGRERRARALRRSCWRRARGLRRARRGADLRRDPDAAWAAPARCGPTSRRGVVPDAITIAKALGGGPADRRAGHRRAPRRRVRARRPRLDVRRRPGRRAGRARRAGADRRPGAARARRASSASGWPPASSACRTCAAVRGRGLMLACELDVDAPAVVRRALLEQRLVLNATGPDHAAAAAAADRSSEAEVDDALAAARGGARRAERCGGRSRAASSSTTTRARIDVDAVHAFISRRVLLGAGRPRELTEAAIRGSQRVVGLYRGGSRSASRARSPTARRRLPRRRVRARGATAAAASASSWCARWSTAAQGAGERALDAAHRRRPGPVREARLRRAGARLSADGTRPRLRFSP